MIDMAKVKDLTGQKFGRLTVIERATDKKYSRPHWICQCECGNTKIIQGNSLTSGATQSCGCFNKERTSEAMKKLNEEQWKNENFRRARSEQMKQLNEEQWQDEDFRQMQKEKIKKQWQDEDFKQMQVEKMKVFSLNVYLIAFSSEYRSMAEVMPVSSQSSRFAASIIDSPVSIPP